jgi:signal transduction histidine kinase
LAISTKILEEHQGRITAENNADGGATFTVILPARS